MTLYARIIFEVGRNPRIPQELLASNLNVTIRTVQRHVTHLEQSGFMVVRRDRKPFTYEVAWDRPLPYFTELTLTIFQPSVQEQHRVAG